MTNINISTELLKCPCCNYPECDHNHNNEQKYETKETADFKVEDIVAYSHFIDAKNWPYMGRQTRVDSIINTYKNVKNTSFTINW